MLRIDTVGVVVRASSQLVAYLCLILRLGHTNGCIYHSFPAWRSPWKG